MSFPRKRESRATATSLALDPRFRGGDSPREMRRPQAFDLILAPMTLPLSHKGRGDSVGRPCFNRNRYVHAQVRKRGSRASNDLLPWIPAFAGMTRSRRWVRDWEGWYQTPPAGARRGTTTLAVRTCTT